VGVLLCVLAAFTLASYAAPPVVESIFPAGGQRGATLTLKSAGKFDVWPISVWSDSPALKIEPAKEKGLFTVHIAADAPLGPRAIRFFTAEGSAPPRCFVIGAGAERNEIEPNDDPSKAQPIESLPITINAQLDKQGDVDSYAVSLTQDQTLIASVQGHRLGSLIDPMLHLLGPDGRQVAFAHDGFGLDPLLVYRAPVAGAYIVRVSAFAHPPAGDVKLAGGKDPTYRLHLTTGPFAYATSPSGVRRGEEASLKLIGWNLPDAAIEVNAAAIPADIDHLYVVTPSDQGQLRIPISDAMEIIAPTDSKAPPLAPPFNLTGQIVSPRQEDVLNFRASKGQRLALVLRPLLASGWAPMLRIIDSRGLQLANADAAGAATAKLEWTAPAEGTFQLVATDLFRSGDPTFQYRLEVRPPFPAIAATADAEAYRIEPGKTASIKITLARTAGYAESLIATASQLPPGITATSPKASAKANDLTIVLTAASDSKTWAGPIHIHLTADAPAPSKLPPIAVLATLRKEADKPPAAPFLESTADLWLTVITGK